MALYAALEAFLFYVAFFLAGSTTHLTWWNALLFATCNAAYVWDPESVLFKRVWVASATLSVLVQVTVMLMSLIGCSMIRDALKEVGPWMYYFGNFALHYWPTIRAASLRPATAPFRLHCDAARIVAIYATLFQASDVYACNVAEGVVLPLGISVALLLECSIVYLLFERPTKLRKQWIYYASGKR